MKIQQSVNRLAKFSAYMLGRRPDEFGLLPDSNGFLKIKDFLKAISEEAGWGYVRRSHLNEVLLAERTPEIEIEGNRIRARSRGHLPMIRPVDVPPKLLYTCVRRGAYARVRDRGIHPSSEQKVMLTVDPELAMRFGRRKDNQPVMLTVNTQAAITEGVLYEQFGEHLYLADFIPSGCFQGPPPPKEKPVLEKQPAKQGRTLPTDAGTFHPDPARIGQTPDERSQHKRGRKRKDPDWKKERRRRRRQKEME